MILAHIFETSEADVIFVPIEVSLPTEVNLIVFLAKVFDN